MKCICSIEITHLRASVITVSLDNELFEKRQICTNAGLKSEVKVKDINKRQLAESLRYLQNCLWFYGKMSHFEAQEKLSSARIGSFLIRMSENPDSKFCFSLSMKTNQDTVKSMRIILQDGFFYTSSSKKFRLFPNVVELIMFYVKRSIKWVNKNSDAHRILPGPMIYPMYHSAPSLAHLCRLEINRVNSEYNRINIEQLPNSFKAYLESYPFTI